MQRNDLIDMASKAGFGKLLAGDGLPTMWHGADLETLDRFADMVSAAEREACAKVCEDLAEAYGDTSPSRALHIAADKMRSNAVWTSPPDA